MSHKRPDRKAARQLGALRRFHITPLVPVSPIPGESQESFAAREAARLHWHQAYVQRKRREHDALMRAVGEKRSDEMIKESTK